PGTPAQVLGEDQVLLTVATIGVPRDERQRTQDAASGRQRDNDVGANPELEQQPQVLAVAGPARQIILGDPLGEEGFARQQYLPYGVGALLLRRVSIAKLPDQRLLRRVPMGQGELPKGSIAPQDVNQAPVREAWDRQGRDPLEEDFVVQGG